MIVPGRTLIGEAVHAEDFKCSRASEETFMHGLPTARRERCNSYNEGVRRVQRSALKSRDAALRGRNGAARQARRRTERRVDGPTPILQRPNSRHEAHVRFCGPALRGLARQPSCRGAGISHLSAGVSGALEGRLATPEATAAPHDIERDHHEKNCQRERGNSHECMYRAGDLNSLQELTSVS